MSEVEFQNVNERPSDHIVTIVVDDVKHRVREGKWIVRDLKAQVGVDAAKALAEITPHGLKELDDNATIEVHEGERFMSHARSGGSSSDYHRHSATA
jgi:hypothetical protein